MEYVILFLVCLAVAKRVIAEIDHGTGEFWDMFRKVVLGVALIGVVASTLAFIDSLDEYNSVPEDVNDHIGANDIPSNILSNDLMHPGYEQLANNIFDFVDSESGVVETSTEIILKGKINLLCDLDIEDYDFDAVKKHKIIKDDCRLYRYTVVGSGETPESTNQYGEWTVAQLDNSVYADKYTNTKGETSSKIKTILHIGIDDNTDISEAEIYLPSTKSKTYLCLAEVQRDLDIVNLYPIFFSLEPNRYYVVKPNLYKLNIDSTEMQDISNVIKIESLENKKDENLLKEYVSSDINKITLTITEVNDKEIIGSINNQNAFEVYIDNVAWKNNGDMIGENLLRVKAETEQEFKLRYTGEIKVGDLLTLEGDMKDVDASFSNIGKVEFKFRVA